MRSRSHDLYDFLFPIVFFNPLHMDAVSDNAVDKFLLLSLFAGLLACRYLHFLLRDQTSE